MDILLKSSGISSTSTTAMRRSPILGHVIICFEDISELAAIRLEDEPLWDGQAKSSRYQNFASGGWFVPDSIRGSETEGTYHGILRSLAEIYRLLHQPLTQFISEREPRPESMKPADYQRTIAARAFDVTRYLLPSRPGRTSGKSSASGRWRSKSPDCCRHNYQNCARSETNSRMPANGHR